MSQSAIPPIDCTTTRRVGAEAKREDGTVLAALFPVAARAPTTGRCNRAVDPRRSPPFFWADDWTRPMSTGPGWIVPLSSIESGSLASPPCAGRAAAGGVSRSLAAGRGLAGRSR